MTELRKHQEQFERMKRWYECIKKIDQGRPHNLSFVNLPSNYFYDEVYTFFLNCYHLKDWIQNDDTVKLPKENVENFINQNECMRVCADICNGIKHLRRESNRSGKDPKFGGREFSLSLGGGPEPMIKVKFSIKTKTGTIDAFELASECVQKWEEFIKDNIN
ncbi:MAG: hypothetical protein DDT22_01383 [candidate division WS2 bacterium]|nr:hypothetical protein [Candidatus Lithacetigena glycinireducens]